MSYSVIRCEDGIDTVALQSQHPELFNVTTRDGVACWKLRPDVRAALRAPLDAAEQRWITARDRFLATGNTHDRAAAMNAALQYQNLLKRESTTSRH
jgi:hypothetical protein